MENNTNSQKTKVPFYLQMWFIVIVFLCTLFIYGIPGIILFLIRFFSVSGKRIEAFLIFGFTIFMLFFVLKQWDDDGSIAKMLHAPYLGPKITDLGEWMEDNKYHPDEVDLMQINYITSTYSEDEFYTVWLSQVHYHIWLYQKRYSWTNEVSNLIKLYKKVYPKSEHMDTLNDISKQSNELLKISDERNRLASKYPILAVDNWHEGSFYITQRLGTEYTENLLGLIQQEIESYLPTTTSNWLAYDTNGDDYVIYADWANPFSEEGLYRINYIRTGETIQIKDNKGFVKDLRILFLLDDHGVEDIKKIQKQENLYLKGMEKFKKTTKYKAPYPELEG